MQRLIRAIIMLVSCCFLSAMASGQSANFTIDDSAGCTPLVVHFTNTTSCASCTYTWDLGNLSTSTLNDVAGSYLTAGTYTITLTATNGASSTVHTSTITVYASPTVNFTADDTSVCPGVPVTFTSTGSSGVPGPVVYSWNFGDGDSSSATNPSHPFGFPGFYNISLSVTNARGCVSSLARTGYEHIFNKPAPNFTGTPTSFCTAPATVNFSNTTPGAGNTYSWSFGDNTSSTTTSPSHNYTAPGTYTVKLRATNSFGCIDSFIRSGYIHIGDLASSFTAPATGCVGSEVTFTNTSTPHVWSSWNFGDASGSTAENPAHVFTAVGTYTVSLVVSNGPCFSTATRTITIYPSPTGTFTITPARPCPPPVTLSYDATVTPGASVAWSFSTPSTGGSSGISVARTFTVSSIYTVTMTVTTPQGCALLVSQLDTVHNLFVNADRGCDTTAVQFTAIALTSTTPPAPYHEYPYGPHTYSWDFGDGTTGTGENAVHSYSAAGTYVATVTVTTGNGCTIKKTVSVQPIFSVPTFTVTPKRVCYGEAVSVTPDTVTGPVDLYEWYWGDGGTNMYAGAAQHVYNRPGQFVITVTPTYHGCKGRKLVSADTVVVDSPKAEIQFGYSCINKDQVAFYDTVSLGADTHLWVFGDGDSSTATNPVHTYPGTGQYDAFLYTLDTLTGCRDTADQPVRVIRLYPEFRANDSTVCRDDTVLFTSTVIYPPADSPVVTASSYEWYIDGVMQPLAINSTYTTVCSTKGIFTISLVSIDAHTCRDTITKPLYLHVAKPVASFNGITYGCAPLADSFIDASTDIFGTSVTKFAWGFGDGWADTSVIPTIAHTYTAGGTYSVTEIVTDDYGCNDTITRSSYIHVTKPFAFFFADNVHPCVGSTVNFTNMTAGVAAAFWYFGDGTVASGISPQHVYTATGSYSVRLIVTDTVGCQDSTRYAGYINVTKPHAAFTMSDTFNLCPPLSVNFANISTGATSYEWHFGDGSGSIVPSPTNVYVASGMYTPTLIATDAWGCQDTAMAHASVFGFAGAFSYTPLSGCSPLAVHFSGAFTGATTGIQWDFADGIIQSGTLDTISHLYTTPGKYIPKLILSDSTGCTNFSSGLDTIKVERVNAAFKTIPDHVCKGGTISFIDSTTTIVSPVYSRSWSIDGSTSTLTSPSHTFTNTGTIPVTLTATNAWGCTGTITKTVTINPLPAVEAGPDVIACAGSATTLVATGAATYTWSGGPLSCITCDTTNAIPAVSTTYSVTGVDTNGCVNKDTLRITILSAIASGGGAMCPGSSITLSNAGGGSWSSADASIANVDSLGVVTGAAPGTVMISYTLPAGCYATVMVTVNSVPAPIVTPPGICTGVTDTVTDSTSGGIWSISAGFTATINSSTGVVTALIPGTATITYTMPTGCIATADITVNAVPAPITGNAPMCVGATLTLANSLTGGSWQSASPDTGAISAAGVVTGIHAGTATITYDHSGCMVTAIVTVDVTPDAGVITGPSIMCAGTSITLSDTATGTWSVYTAVATISTAGVLHGLRIGDAVIIYTTPTNSAGCFDTAMYIVIVDSPASRIFDTISNVSCYGGHDGRIAVFVDRPIPYKYTWSNGGDTTSIDSLTVGVYSLTVSDTTSGCYNTASYTIVQPDALVASVVTAPDSCFAGTGRASLSVEGGVSPYQYLWSNTASASEITGLMPGAYSVTVTDMHSCIVHMPAIVAEDSCFDVRVYDVITPNADGVNDVWVIEGLSHYPQNTVQIFDKWGDLVYERSNYSNEWYGQGRGSALLPDGTYFYLVKLNAPNRAGGENVFKGTILIKR